MKLIIDIPEEAYRDRKMSLYFGCYSGQLHSTLYNGIPLDKIRAEIDENLVHDDWDFGQEIYYNSAINDVLQIIDKYKAEKE